MIIVSTQCFPPAPGGIESLMYHLCTGLVRAGEDVHVYADSGNDAEQVIAYDATLPFPVHRYGGLKIARRYRKAHAIRRFIAGVTDARACLLADTWKSLEMAPAGMGTWVVCLAHGSELPPTPSSRKYRRIHRAYARADVIVANSHYTAGLLVNYGIAPDKVRVIHPGIAAPAPDPVQQQSIRTRLAQHYPVLITVARLEQRKGHKQVIESIPGLKQDFPGILYLVIGEGTEREALEQLTWRLGITDNVCFTGTLQGPERDAYLANSTVFVMPGLIKGGDVEGFGMAYLEAACLGIPALASDSGGSPEAVLHEQTGLICAAGDRQQLAESLHRLARDATLRTRLGECARERARGFLWPQKINEYLPLLRPQD